MATAYAAGGENAPFADMTATMIAANQSTASAARRCPVCHEDPVRPCPSCRKIRARVMKLYEADLPLGEMVLVTGIAAPALERIIRQERARQQAQRDDLAAQASLQAARRELGAAVGTGDEFTARERAKVASGISVPNRPVREAIERFLAVHPRWTLDGVLVAARFDRSQARRFLGYADAIRSRKPIRDGHGGLVVARDGVAVRDGTGRLICDEYGQPILPDPAGRPVRARRRCGSRANWSVIAIPGRPVLRVYEPTRARILDVDHALRLLAVIGLDPQEIPGLRTQPPTTSQEHPMHDHTTTSALDRERLIFDEALHRRRTLAARPASDYRYTDHDDVVHQVLVVPMVGQRLRIIDETPTTMRLVDVLKLKRAVDGDKNSALAWARDYAAQWQAYYDGDRDWPPVSVTEPVTRIAEQAATSQPARGHAGRERMAA